MLMYHKLATCLFASLEAKAEMRTLMLAFRRMKVFFSEKLGLDKLVISPENIFLNSLPSFKHSVINFGNSFFLLYHSVCSFFDSDSSIIKISYYAMLLCR